jgi:predicted S18 family serine protease
MSEYGPQIHRAIQSYDDGELRTAVASLARAARREHRTVESLIIDLKQAVSALSERALLKYERRELCDAVVSVAIRAYYDPAELTPRTAVFNYRSN